MTALLAGGSIGKSLMKKTLISRKPEAFKYGILSSLQACFAYGSSGIR